MGTQKAHQTNYGRYVGRVGALAAALGIGVMGVVAPATAGADTTGTGAESSSSSTTTSQNSADSANAASADGAESSTATDVESESDEVANDEVALEDNESGSGPDTSGGEADPAEIDDPEGGASPDAGPPGEPHPAESPAAEEQPVIPGAESDSGSTGDKADGSHNAEVTTASSPAAKENATPVEQPSLPQPEIDAEPATNTQKAAGGDGTVHTTALVAAAAPITSTAQTAQAPTGFIGLLNSVVTNLLNPFLAAPPETGEPITPLVWGLLGWVRRNLFNQAPVVSIPTTISQTGQTVTGDIGVTDPEGDALKYTIKQQPKYGTLTIDQTTGMFTYTPNDINYTAVQEDAFTVSVTDRGFNLLGLFTPRSVSTVIDVDVLSPQVQRVIVNMPADITRPVNPRYAEGGQSIVFAGTPSAGGRQEIYQIDIDGTDAKCLTCGLAAPSVAGTNPALPINVLKPVPFYDGTGRIVVLLNNPDPRYAIFEPAGYNGVGSPARIVDVMTPDGGGATLPGLPFPGGIINRQREMRPSPDGTHVLFTRIVIGQTGNFQALPIVGALTANGDHYEVTNARVVWPTGESKQWTPDGKGVIIQGGAFEAGNVDDILVDLSGETGKILYPGSPFRGIRVTGNLDYDEDIDMSPNKQWITVGSTRGFEALTPMTRIVRQNFLPFYVGAAIYDQYADGQVRNVSNQNWLVAIADDLNRENGIPLFVQDDPATPGVDEGDGWISRSMPSWNLDGTAVTFWESGNGDEHGVPATESRLVIANLKYTTSVGTVGDTATVFDPSAFPALGTYVAKTTPLPPTGTYGGVGGGTAVVSEVFDATTFQTTRTVQYTNYVNEDGLILNGNESSTYGPSQLSVTYLADIDVTDATGATRGGLNADAVYTLLPTQSVSGYITSTLDGDTQTLPDLAKVEDAKTGA